MRIGKIPMALAVAALMQPPIAVDARVVVVPACGAQPHKMLLPGDPVDPNQRRGCDKACHAVTERRGKFAGAKRGCC
ncbi:hypothetical protein [Sphingopyxis sp.]|uniref:hypothetical protein n=1 Tax=Sphingopyxis sp. TaxID=1908224 RepID=UPI003D0BD403